MIVKLKEDCIIAGIPRAKGEIVYVPKDFPPEKIERVLKK